MALKLNSSSGGSVTLQEPTTASNYTLTVPAQTATLAVNGPAFSAYMSTNQSVSSGVFTKVQFNTEIFDTNSNFDTATYRFTPTIAGYYQVNAGVYDFSSASVSREILSIYKNGSEFKRGNDIGGTVYQLTVSGLVYCNGSTDYIEIYALVTGTSPVLGSGSNLGWFDGCLVRAA